jgi:NitT/TauT family transport system ATP-binding protein
VTLTGVRRVFGGGHVALDGLCLRIGEGSFVAIVGPSGCGKSTLLRLVAGLDAPDAGTIHIAEGRRLAFVFQDAHLLPWRTVEDNVALPLELAGTPRDEARRLAREPLAEVELDAALDRYPDELSGGMRMRVSIARALVVRPDILLLDEPFAALDELTRQRLDDRLRSLHAAHPMTVLFVTHALSEALFLSERVIVLSPRPGRIVFDHAVQLPAQRAAAIRADVAFARQHAILYAALERGL